MDALTIFQIQNMMEDRDFDFINDIKKVNLKIISLDELYEVWEYSPQRFHYLEKLCFTLEPKITKEEWKAINGCVQCCEFIDYKNLIGCSTIKRRGGIERYLCAECLNDVRTKG